MIFSLPGQNRRFRNRGGNCTLVHHHRSNMFIGSENAEGSMERTFHCGAENVARTMAVLLEKGELYAFVLTALTQLSDVRFAASVHSFWEHHLPESGVGLIVTLTFRKSLKPTSCMGFQRVSIVGLFCAAGFQLRVISSRRIGCMYEGMFGRSFGRTLIARRMII